MRWVVVIRRAIFLLAVYMSALTHASGQYLSGVPVETVQDKFALWPLALTLTKSQLDGGSYSQVKRIKGSIQIDKSITIREVWTGVAEHDVEKAALERDFIRVHAVSARMPDSPRYALVVDHKAPFSLGQPPAVVNVGRKGELIFTEGSWPEEIGFVSDSIVLSGMGCRLTGVYFDKPLPEGLVIEVYLDRSTYQEYCTVAHFSSQLAYTSADGEGCTDVVVCPPKKERGRSKKNGKPTPAGRRGEKKKGSYNRPAVYEDDEIPVTGQAASGASAGGGGDEEESGKTGYDELFELYEAVQKAKGAKNRQRAMKLFKEAWKVASREAAESFKDAHGEEEFFLEMINE